MELEAVKAYFREQVVMITGDYLKDLESMTEEQLGSSPGDSARTVYDYTYEVAYVNRRLAKRISGEDPGPWPFDEFARAPEEFRSKAAAVESITKSTVEVLAAWDALPANDLLKQIPLKDGATSPLDLIFTIAHHTSYHDGQMNFYQSMLGDTGVHW